MDSPGLVLAAVDARPQSKEGWERILASFWPFRLGVLPFGVERSIVMAQATARSFLTLGELDDGELLELTDADNRRALKEFLASCATRRVVALSDEEARAQFPQFTAKIALWRAYATVMGYTGPVCWLVRKGFTLKVHAAKAGPCHDTLNYLQSWSLRNDEPTTHSLVFWIPRLAQDSTGKSDRAMETLRGELRTGHNLPENHCDRFGSVALLFALILRHFKLTGERVPIKFLYAASDTFHEDGYRLIAGSFDRDGLGCRSWGGRASDGVGFFLLGVEELGS